MGTAATEIDPDRLDVAEFLRANRRRLTAIACEQLADARLAHYPAADPVSTEQRVQSLYDVVVAACAARRLDVAVNYADHLARARLDEGVSLDELQAAVNAIESTLWRAISTGLPAERVAQVLAPVATVLGAIKDRLGCEYVAAATAPKRIAVDKLFAGTDANLTEPST